MKSNRYDCTIIGGGLAGLSLSILLARENRKVILFEKESFPFHKVCGEYISNESVPFLRSLGIRFEEQNLPQINQLFLSSPSGIGLKCPLDIGGTGLSRYALDSQLFALAERAGVDVRSGTKVQQVHFQNGQFEINAGKEYICSKTAVGAFGKGSNMDVQLGRKYRAQSDKDLFIAVKYHIQAPFFDRNCVEMHHFKGGYCGLSAIEEGRINMSYISKAINLKREGSIPNLERNVLSRNPFLRRYFESAEFLFEKPLTISHLHFEIKNPVADHLLLLGDAAGNIAPLSGNGMSMALRSAKLACESLLPYMNGETTLTEMEGHYAKCYYNTFSKRIRIARQVNQLANYPEVTNWSFRFLRLFPGIVDLVSKKLHGDVF